jgi:hypothetical protein
MSNAATGPGATGRFEPDAPMATAGRERLWPSPGMWLIVLGLGASFGLVVARYSDTWALVTLVASTVVIAALLLASTPLVGVVDGMFVAGRARIPVELTGAVDVLDADGMRQAHGPELDARAYLCLRGWVTPGLRVHLVDPEDPTPYWLVSSRRPAGLAAAVQAARVARGSG